MRAMETSENILSYRRDLENINDTLNTIMAKVDELEKVQSIDTYSASALESDLEDIIGTANMLSALIRSRSIR